MQMDLLARLEEHGKFASVVSRQISLAGLDEASANTLVDTVANHVRAGEAYRVSPEMAAVTIHAARGLDEDDKVDRSLAPTPCGIVRFDHPLPAIDARGVHQKVHWITWGPGVVVRKNAFGQDVEEPSVVVTAWNDTADPDEVSERLLNSDDPKQREAYRSIMGRWSMVGMTTMPHGRSLGPSEIDPEAQYAESIISAGDTPIAYTNVMRYLHALWLLLDQTITDVRPEHLRTSVAKKAWKKNLPGRVTVIQLRRTANEGKTAGESSVDWSHRWLVRGHWRWQACGPGNAERKRIWIHPFVKGPEDKPLVVNPKVYDMRR